MNNWEAFIGGMLIGTAAAVLLMFCGRIAGNSGIIGGVFKLKKDRGYWRVFYILGLLCGAVLYRVWRPGVTPVVIDASIPLLAVAGLLVGYGTRLGSGCTSGHGVCGMARLSKRSIIATLLFMVTAVVTYQLRKMGGVW